MIHTLTIVLSTIVGMAALVALVLFLEGGLDSWKVVLALRCMTRVLRDPVFAGKIESLLVPPPPIDVPPPKPSGAPLRLLALLQREGRLLDFLLEDIQSYPDAHIGAAVRDIH